MKKRIQTLKRLKKVNALKQARQLEQMKRILDHENCSAFRALVLIVGLTTIIGWMLGL